MKFSQLHLITPLLKALERNNYTVPTPIQAEAIPSILRGHDVFACAQTGTGKTAAFALPILQNMTLQKDKQGIRALILAPTRELAIQIGNSFQNYGAFLPLRQSTIYGGVSQNKQVAEIRRGIDILVATPGRLLDLINQGFISLGQIEYFVLDEADRMLDMGFIHDIRKVIRQLPSKKQSLFFSATTSKEINQLANSILNQPIHISVTPPSSVTPTIEQSVYFVKKEHKHSLLEHILKSEFPERALVFTRTKRGADKVAKKLTKSGLRAEAIHGNKSQSARVRVLEGFKKNKLKILVATDIASRGIDVDNLTHVINFELPELAETYVHRIGRTGRAGSLGKALSFCTADEKTYLRGIHKLVKSNIEVVKSHPFV